MQSSTLIFHILSSTILLTVVIEARSVLDSHTYPYNVKHFESKLDTTTGYWSPSTSSIDWCERNYAVTQYIAEFWNCISSLLMCILAGILLIQGLYNRIENRFLLLSLSFGFVGFGSAYFHGTLTHFGQMADELPMVYSMIVWWFILFRMNKFNQLKNKKFAIDILLVFGIFYGFLWTYVHSLQTFVLVFQVHFTLMVLGGIIKLIYLYRQTQHHTHCVKHLIMIYVSLLAPAIICWLIDQQLCERMNSIGGFNPQLHAWWHVFCAVDCHVGIVCVEAMRLLSIKYQQHQVKDTESFDQSFKPDDHVHIVFFLVLPFVDYSKGAYCVPIFDDELNNQWSLFKRTHRKQYALIEEEITRRTIWEANLAKIRQHNLEADLNIHSYTLGMNRFGDMSHEEFKKQMNGFNMLANIENSNFDHHTLFAPTDVTVSRAVDWRKEGFVTAVKDQGPCGSSWAFSAIGALEDQHFRQTKQRVPLSVQNLIDCSDDFGNAGCNGGFINASFQYIKVNGGIDTEESYPYEARYGTCRFNSTNIGANSTGFRNIESKSEAALSYAIAIVGPISVFIDASQSSFQFYRSGVYDEPNCSSIAVDHCALVVGFNATDSQLYYIVKNSWGTSWGQDGYIWMSRNKNNQCGIATMASFPLV